MKETGSRYMQVTSNLWRTLNFSEIIKKINKHKSKGIYYNKTRVFSIPTYGNEMFNLLVANV